MNFLLTQGSLSELNTDCLIVAIYENRQLSKIGQQLDQLSENQLSNIIAMGDINGKLAQTLMLHNIAGIQAKRILLVGCGEANKFGLREYKQVNSKVAQLLSEMNVEDVISTLIQEEITQQNLYWKTRVSIESIQAALYQFDQFKSKKAPITALHSVRFWNENTDSTIESAIFHANAVAYGVKMAKDVANCPPNICNPAYLAECAKKLMARSDKITTTIIDESQMAELNMNAYLAVSQGSQNPAYMSIIEYRNAPNKDEQPIVLVGKGLTFDTGGISIKPAAEMDEMKYDMGGAAAVYGVMEALAELDLPINVIGVLAGCENMPDGNAYRPGDIIKTMAGLTVEVLNTDAEGRLVLCDALAYVERFNPKTVIDVATLTGACVVALGQHMSGLVTPHDDLANALLEASTQTKDEAWRLPLTEDYKAQLKSNFADITNLGGRWGGASTAAAFLSHFTEKYHWAHIDCAGTAWKSGAEKGATGRPVSLLTQYLLNQVKH